MLMNQSVRTYRKRGIMYYQERLATVFACYGSNSLCFHFQVCRLPWVTNGIYGLSRRKAMLEVVGWFKTFAKIFQIRISSER